MMKMNRIAIIEVTDTFAGEANYSWCRTSKYCYPETGKIPSEKSVVRKLRNDVGLTGVKCKRTEYGDMIRYDVVGQSIVSFITWDFE
jgi:hypothetical protein